MPIGTQISCFGGLLLKLKQSFHAYGKEPHRAMPTIHRLRMFLAFLHVVVGRKNLNPRL